MVGDSNRPFRRRPGVSRILARPKSSTLTDPSGSELDVGRLQITVNDSMLVSRFDRIRNLLRNLQRFVKRNWAVRDPIRERRPVDQLHHQALDAIGLLHAVDLAMCG